MNAFAIARSLFAPLMATTLLAVALPAALRESKEAYERLTPSEQRRILQNAERFDKLPQAEKDALRQLHDAVENSGAERPALELAMARYARWLQTLSPAQRDRLLGIRDVNERLAAAKSILDEQAKQLASDLKPLENLALAPAGPTFSWSGRFFSELEMLRVTLRDKLTDAEMEKLLATQSLGDKAPLLLSLACKYGIPTPPPLQVMQAGMFQELQETLADQRFALFAGKSFRDLSSEQKRQFGELLTQMLLAPTLESKKQSEFVDQLDSTEQKRLVRMARRTPSLAGQLITVLYYLQPEHRAEAPKDLHQLLKALPPLEGGPRSNKGRDRRGRGPFLDRRLQGDAP